MVKNTEQISMFVEVKNNTNAERQKQKLQKSTQTSKQVSHADMLRYLENSFPDNLGQGVRLPLCGVPLGMTAVVLVALQMRFQRPLLFVAADERAMREVEDALTFFAANSECICYPSWDCQPYDRVSPSREQVAARLNFLARIADVFNNKKNNANNNEAPPFMLTTVAALLQRVVPKNFLENNPPLTIAKGGKFDRREFGDFALRNGYQREDVVRRIGDYAVRGSLIDIFPANEPSPIRIDCDGDMIDSVKSFDVISQRSFESLQSVHLLPASEAPLSNDSWSAFRARYLQRFGVAFSSRDPLFAEAEHENGINGFEHLLPLFFDRMATLAEYLPRECVVVFGQDTREASLLRRETIEDHFEARKLLQQEEEQLARKNKKTLPQAIDGNEARLRAVLPPDALYLSQDEWQNFTDASNEGKLSSFSYAYLHRASGLAPLSDANPCAEDHLSPIDCGGRTCPDFTLALREDRLYEDLRARTQRKPHLFTARTQAALVRLAERLRENAVPIETIRGYSSLVDLPQGIPAAAPLFLRRGFDAPQLAVVSEFELFGERFGARVRRRKCSLEALLTEARTLVVGEIVVHSEHGIGRFDGLLCVMIGGAPHDCVKIIYAEDEVLYLPVEGLESLSRFGVGGEKQPTLDRLGGSGFAIRKARAKHRIKELADKLVATMAARHMQSAPIFQVRQDEWQKFQMGFPYAETDDQSTAIQDVVDDLKSGRIMDRIICGDAGFGKTEVALRAAFIVVAEGAQVLMLAPTTLLAEQHARLFKDRFAHVPMSSTINIGVLSRLRTAKERAETRKRAERGEIQILIGTHAALAKNIVLPNLALQIIDEEQSFGVEQKERWKKSDAHLLSLSATPIPRSLNMALAGLRDISTILSPPHDRLLVRSFVLDFDAVSLGEALRREHLRGGQAFCVVPRITDLARTQVLLKKIAPDAKIVVAHGRLPPTILEQRVRSFIQGEYDLLLSTNIVEAGLDIPRANTMVILDSYRFGLAQLYQLRGRVGRAKLRGYCYFFIPEYARKQKHAMQRLQLMETLDSAGAGLRVSMQDLDMRGAGNLLGEEQSGKIREIGVELYRKLLSNAIAEKKKNNRNKDKDKSGIEPSNVATKEAVAHSDVDEDGQSVTPIAKEVRISLGIPVLIPPRYVREEGLRMALYRRLSMLESEVARQDFRDELQDRFGEIPEEVDNLLEIFQIKEWAALANIESLEAGGGGITVRFAEKRFAAPEKLILLLQRHAGKRLKLGKEQNLLWRIPLGKSSVRRKRASRCLVRLLAEMSANQYT